jgi:hypothetical protein
MTDLQVSLMAIGGSIVVGVISYNKWQEYKAKKSVERAFSSAHDDVLMNPAGAATTERQEPTLATGHSAAAIAEAGEEGVSPAPETVLPAAAAAPAKGLPVDALIDCAIAMSLENPMRGDKILPSLLALRHIGNKPVHYIGLGQDGGWECLVHGGLYTGLKAGVQIANRNSPLNELEYSELIMQLRHIADGLGAELDVPDMTEVMVAAKSLHRFVSEHDAQLGVNVHSNGAPWAINTLLTSLERQGFDLRPDGRFVMQDGDGGVLYSLSTNVTLAEESTSRLTLLLDVPCVAPMRDGFGAMVACAKSLVKRLDGTIVDDSNRPLSDEALQEIAGQVAEFYDDMQAVEIPAGSSRALRLFS